MNNQAMSPADKAKLIAIVKAQKKRDCKARWAKDFAEFARDQIKILPKDITKGFIPFEMNAAQSIIHEGIERQKRETGMVRVIILKARQQGISTYCSSRVFHRVYFEENHKSVVMAHDAPTSEALFQMSGNIVNHMDAEYRPEMAKSNAREIKFEHNNSGYRLYTAGSAEAGRGTTPTIAHLTEVAFWQFAPQILSGLFQGVPSVAGTEIILESTANGTGNEFHRLWQGAVAGTNGYLAIFIPWFMTDEYRMPVPGGIEWGPEDLELAERFDLDEEQLYWRRLKIGESGPVKFRQEYPATPEEAFITSGANVFDLDKVAAYEPQPAEVYRKYDFATKQFEKDAPVTSHLRVYKAPEAKEPYVIAADPSLGVGRDYASAVIMNRQREVCAVFRDNRLDPTLFGIVLFYLGRYYNNGMVAVETNNMGIATLNKLVELQYQNLYYQTKIANVSKEEGTKPGWKTTHISKPNIIALLKSAVENFEIWIPDPVIIHELKMYVMDDSGATGAAVGEHDDTVMATAIALEVLRTHADRLTVTNVPYWQKSNSVEIDQTEWL